MGNTILGKPYAPFSKAILQQQLVCIDRLWFIALQTTRGKDESNIVLLVGNCNGHHNAEIRTYRHK